MEILTPDTASIAIIRTLIPDTEAVFDGTTLFTDTEIGHYYTAGRGSIPRAAAFAMLAIANSEAIISKVIRTQDLQTDGAKLAEAMRKNAEALFARADKEDELDNGFYFNIVDYGFGQTRPELTELDNTDLYESGFGMGGFGN